MEVMWDVIVDIIQFVDEQYLYKDWIVTCHSIRNHVLDPAFIRSRISQGSSNFRILYYYSRLDRALIETFPQTFAKITTDILKTTSESKISTAVPILADLFGRRGFNPAKPESLQGILDLTHALGLMIPPDLLYFYTLCDGFGEHQRGLVINSASAMDIRPHCWSHKTCQALIRIGEWTDGAADGATYLYIVCDPFSPWFGRMVYYSYRTDGKFHLLEKGRWGFGDFVECLMWNKLEVKRHTFEECYFGSDKIDIEGICSKPVPFPDPSDPYLKDLELFINGPTIKHGTRSKRRSR
eukprot:TRINITY_DN17091_c0_g1_i1.p1 TRINITY_DN17091_c0_g1~~TRINITY_DN17091_c0_g1_i1.p1  ORF type:complete len:296 (-),score=42.72 TRINITY_DN17091_c0_g1_i1:206-1093(-)